MPITPAYAALAGAGATLGGYGLQYLGQQEANQANAANARYQTEVTAQMARAQMEFQQYNSDTAYRRAKKDLESAGFNPMLALGEGASTPQGAAGSAGTADIKNPVPPLGNLVTSAIETVQAVNALEKQDAETNFIKGNTSKIPGEKERTKSETEYNRAKTKSEQLEQQKRRVYSRMYDQANQIMDKVGQAHDSSAKSYKEKTFDGQLKETNQMLDNALKRNKGLTGQQKP